MLEFLGVFVGALLAFLVGIAVNEIVDLRRRKSNSALARDLVGTELVHNLEVLNSMKVLATETKDQGFVSVHQPIASLRSDVLSQVIGSDWLISLTPSERRFLVEVAGNLKRAGDEHSNWMAHLTHETGGLATVIIQDTGEHTTVREFRTDRLYENLGFIMTHLIDLLVQVCNNSDLDQLTDDRTKQIAEKLGPTREGWPDKRNFARTSQSSELRALAPDKLAELVDEYARLVVWTHDWKECPLPTIELQTRQAEAEFRPL